MSGTGLIESDISTPQASPVRTRFPQSQLPQSQLETVTEPQSSSQTRQEPPPALYAIADLHISHKLNATALTELRPRPGSGLIIAGDVGESLAQLHITFDATTKLFDQVWWVPGNHELYTLPSSPKTKSDAEAVGEPDTPLRGEAKYLACVRVARKYGVHTPEDDFTHWTGTAGGSVLVAPLFTLYDYSFRPDHVSRADAIKWARADNGTEATDEVLLHADPHTTRDAWCHALVERMERKLEAARLREPNTPLVLVNHWPLREDLVHIPRVPRFSLWCGTKLTEDWHQRFRASVVVTGHLHVRRTDWRDSCRFEEVSLGYPRQWEDAKKAGLDINDLLRVIWPAPESDQHNRDNTRWRRFG